MRRRNLTYCSLVACAFVAACGDDEPTTTIRGTGRPIVATPTPKPGVPGAPTPGKTEVATELGPFTYKPGRDPFQSYFDVTTEAPVVVTKLEPLQKHELSSLKVIAIATGTVQPAAVVVDPGGKSWLVRRGTLIGPPRGRVAQILTDRVVVEREYKDRLDRIHKLRSQLRIRPGEEEAEQAQQEGAEEHAEAKP